MQNLELAPVSVRYPFGTEKAHQNCTNIQHYGTVVTALKVGEIVFQTALIRRLLLCSLHSWARQMAVMGSHGSADTSLFESVAMTSAG